MAASAIAHFADLLAQEGTGQVDFPVLCDLLRSGNFWVRLSAAYRLSSAPPYSDLALFAQQLLAARSDRVLWGIDRPHVNFRRTMPNTSDLLDCLLEWVPDAQIRRKILVENPQAFYGFAPVIPARTRGDQS